MAVELSEAQIGVVAEFLARYVSELSAEIATADDPARRADLLRRRELLRGALSALAPDAETSDDPGDAGRPVSTGPPAL